MLRMQLRDADPWADAGGSAGGKSAVPDEAGGAAVADAVGKIWESISSVFSSAVPPAPAPGGPSAVTPPIPTPGGPAVPSSGTQVTMMTPVSSTPFYRTPIGLILIGLGAFAGWKIYKKRKAA